jgi:threonine/homoserine/homoserine lactone efflux protein
MSGDVYLAFIAVSTAVIVVPGPSVLLIIANTLKNGARTGLFTVGGTSLAIAIQLGVAVAGLSSLVTRLAAGQRLIRWLGIAYLLYLGLKRWQNAGRSQGPDSHAISRGRSAFVEGFAVSLTNPATLLFFIAFFPQFLGPSEPPLRGLALMAVTFWTLALAFDCMYTGLAASVSSFLDQPRWHMLRDRVTACVLLAAAAALAFAHAEAQAIP